MEAHVLKHVDFEDIGSIKPWLVNRNWEISYTHFFESPQGELTFPEPDKFDLLIIMGGPMSANDENQYSWLKLEKAFIKAAIDSGKPVLGICLGAQLIANVLGSRIVTNPVKEIGWFPIQQVKPSPNPSNGHFQFPETMDAFHWHGETFSLPSGSTNLAKSNACEVQAFQYKNHVIALQFHLEMTPESIEKIVTHCGDELTTAPFIQTAEEILNPSPDLFIQTNQLMEEILTFLIP